MVSSLSNSWFVSPSPLRLDLTPLLGDHGYATAADASNHSLPYLMKVTCLLADTTKFRECMFKKRRTSIRRWNSSTPVAWGWQTSAQKVWNVFELSSLDRLTLHKILLMGTWNSSLGWFGPWFSDSRLRILVKKAFRRKRGYFYGVNGRQRLTAMWTCKTLLLAGPMALPCQSRHSFYVIPWTIFL